MANVTIKSKDGNLEHVTLDTFKVWKKNNGARAAFAVSEQDDGVTIVDSLPAMRSLPEGQFTAEKLERSTVPNKQFEKHLRAARIGAWKVV